MTTKVKDALAAFLARCEVLWNTEAHQPLQEFDPDWDSPCFYGELIDGKKAWRPVARDICPSFENIENALEILIDPQLPVLFGSYFCDHLPAHFEGQHVDLIQAWNSEDFERLQENMLAHLMMKKQLKQSPTLFIACCEDDMEIIAIDNTTGEVVLETLGKGVSRVIAPDLATFLDGLTPVIA